MRKSIRSTRHQRLVEVLTAARKQVGLTQVELAKRLERPQSFVAKYETGERRLDVIEFIELAEALGGNPKKVFAQVLSTKKIS